MKALCSRILVCVVCAILFVPLATVLFIREGAVARAAHAVKEAKAQRGQEQRELDETLEKPKTNSGCLLRSWSSGSLA